MTKPALLVVSPLPAAVARRAAADYDATFAPGRNLTPDEVVAHCRDVGADAILLTGRVPMKADHVAALPARVRILATCSVGYDHVDVAAAAARGLPASGCLFAGRCVQAQDRCRAEAPPLAEVAPGHLARCHFPVRRGGA